MQAGAQASPRINIRKKLRSVVQDNLDKGLFSSAIFFADKLVTLSNGGVEEVYLLAKSYYGLKQFRRALHLLDKYSYPSTNLQCLCLAAQCLLGCREWEEGLEILGDEATDPSKFASLSSNEPTSVILATLCLLRGKFFEATDNRARAAHWFKEALKLDIFCYEAFENLVDNHLLSNYEENELLEALPFNEETMYLKHIYYCKLTKYDEEQQEQMKSFEVLETKYALKSNHGVLAAKAEAQFYSNNFNETYKLTQQILEEDPFSRDKVLCVHISTLVELRLKTELFYCAHKLVEENSSSVVSWYAVACYYYVCGNHEEAKKMFNKATTIDPHFGPAWLGYGHAFAVEGEHDQAMAAYRTASRMLSGCHIPLLCIGMELVRVNNFNLAQQMMQQAIDICPHDPLIYNELGVIFYKNNDYDKAATLFRRALNLCTNGDNDKLNDSWEPTLFNAGHAYRKMGQYEEAIRYYQQALSIRANNASAYSALGFTHHLQGDIETAIEYYHNALSISPEDTFTIEVLNLALSEVVFC